MVFGKQKKPKKEAGITEEIMEVPHENMVGQPTEPIPGFASTQNFQPVPEQNIPIAQEQVQVQQASVQPMQADQQVGTTTEGKGKILDGVLLENGLIRYTVIANKPIGNVGEEFPID